MENNLLLDYEEKETPHYKAFATIWQRIGVFLIDTLLLNAFFTICRKYYATVYYQDESTNSIVKYDTFNLLLIIIVPLLYFTLFESSKFQGTLGKIALKIQITDFTLNRISIKTAIHRFCLKILFPYSPVYIVICGNIWRYFNPLFEINYTFDSYFRYLIFFLLAISLSFSLFTHNKQALHDIATNTIVLKKHTNL